MSIYGLPIIGTASTPAELVALLQAAHLARLAAAEHGVGMEDRYVVNCRNDRNIPDPIIRFIGKNRRGHGTR